MYVGAVVGRGIAGAGWVLDTALGGDQEVELRLPPENWLMVTLAEWTPPAGRSKVGIALAGVDGFRLEKKAAPMNN